MVLDVIDPQTSSVLKVTRASRPEREGIQSKRENQQDFDGHACSLQRASNPLASNFPWHDKRFWLRDSLYISRRPKTLKRVQVTANFPHLQVHVFRQSAMLKRNRFALNNL